MRAGLACSKCFSVLGIPSRMKIYFFLKDKGKSTVSSVIPVVKLTQPTVSYHLKEMKQNGLLESVKEGKEVYYSVTGTCHGGETCLLNQLDYRE